MTNGTFFKELSQEEKLNFRKQYGQHPLREFIDWEKFYNSENGNEMDFVKFEKKCKMVIDTDVDIEIQEESDVYILLNFLDNDDNNTEYWLVYSIEDNCFYKIPSDTPVEIIGETNENEKSDEKNKEIIIDNDNFKSE